MTSPTGCQSSCTSRVSPPVSTLPLAMPLLLLPLTLTLTLRLEAANFLVLVAAVGASEAVSDACRRASAQAAESAGLAQTRLYE